MRENKIMRFNERSDISEGKIQKVKAIQDESGHWYVINRI